MSRLLPIICLFVTGCGTPGIQIPQGDPEIGRGIFNVMACHSCHTVPGEDFPAPTAQPPVPVAVGDPRNKKSRTYLAESILAPSHRFAQPPEIIMGLVIIQQEYRNIETPLGGSRMFDYRDAMTVSDWLDLVAYLEAMQSRSRRLTEGN